MLVLGISRSGVSRLLEPPEPTENNEFAIVKAEVFADSRNRCDVCGFVSDKYQHGHHIDGNHKNNIKQNISCRDPLCHLCEHVGYVGMQKMGQLVMCREIDQATLNCIQRIAWVTKFLIDTMPEGTYGPHLMNIARESNKQLELLKPTFIQVERTYGFKTPDEFAKRLESLSDNDYLRRNELFPNVRLLFYPKFFSNEIRAWSQNSEHFKDFYHPDNWGDLADELMR